MPCVSLKNNRDYKASLKQAKILACQQVSEQNIVEKTSQMPQNSENTTIKTLKSRKTTFKTTLEQQKSKLAAKQIMRRAAKAEKKATRISQKAAKRAIKATTIQGVKAQNTTASRAAEQIAVAAGQGAKIAETTLKIPHTHETGKSTTKVEPAKKVKPAKLTPKTDIPGIISTKTAKKQRPIPSTIFKRSNNVNPTRADLINAESRLGSQLFGAIPAGHRREFFHDQKNIWIWHEDWTDETEHEHEMTIRYEIRTSGVYKKVSAGKYFKLEGEELENFRKATHAYLYVIKKYLYNHPYSKVVA